jgi:hypothetical protein
VTAPALFLSLALAVALVAGGAVAAFASGNALKKIAAVLIALVGATLALGVLGAPTIALSAAVAIALAYVATGVAVAVRLQEAYGAIEAREIDAADERDEPRETET